MKQYLIQPYQALHSSLLRDADGRLMSLNELLPTINRHFHEVCTPSNVSGQIPLHLAIIKEQPLTVLFELLKVEKKKQVAQTNSEGYTALELAITRSHLDTVKLLLVLCCDNPDKLPPCHERTRNFFMNCTQHEDPFYSELLSFYRKSNDSKQTWLEEKLHVEKSLFLTTQQYKQTDKGFSTSMVMRVMRLVPLVGMFSGKECVNRTSTKENQPLVKKQL